jgi:hypothetical protein
MVFLFTCAVAAASVIGGLFSGAAKRRSPARINPIQIRGLEFRAPNNFDSEGIVEAWDMQTKNLLWRKKIYFSLKMPLTEDQGNFMRSMTNGPSTNELTIVNERGGHYILDTASRKFKTVKAAISKGSW